MTSCRALGVQRLVVDDDVEHTLRPGHERQRLDDVLVVVQEIMGSAHGALGIVSRHAVGDADHMLGVAHGFEGTWGPW